MSFSCDDNSFATPRCSSPLQDDHTMVTDWSLKSLPNEQPGADSDERWWAHMNMNLHLDMSFWAWNVHPYSIGHHGPRWCSQRHLGTLEPSCKAAPDPRLKGGNGANNMTNFHRCASPRTGWISTAQLQGKSYVVTTGSERPRRFLWCTSWPKFSFKIEIIQHVWNLNLRYCFTPYWLLGSLLYSRHRLEAVARKWAEDCVQQQSRGTCGKLRWWIQTAWSQFQNHEVQGMTRQEITKTQTEKVKYTAGQEFLSSPRFFYCVLTGVL